MSISSNHTKKDLVDSFRSKRKKHSSKRWMEKSIIVNSKIAKSKMIKFKINNFKISELFSFGLFCT